MMCSWVGASTLPICRGNCLNEIANGRYRKALLELGADKFAGELTEEEDAERTALLVSCQLNAAACWLKLGKPIKAEANCSQARTACADPTAACLACY